MVNLGINIIETNGTASAAIAGAPTSVAGFIIRSRRGPTDEAVRISNFRQFKARFGGYDPGFMGAYCVDGFFLNGGREAYVTRVQGANSKAASVTLQDRIGTPTLKVTAGYRGTADPGTWGNDLSVGIRDNPRFSTALAATLAGNQPARVQGAAIRGTVNLVTHRTLSLEVDNSGSPISISLDAANLPNPSAASAQDVVDAINTVAGERGVVASVSGGGIAISRYGTGESAAISIADTDNATLGLLGFAAPTPTSDAWNPDAPDDPVRLQGTALDSPVDLTSFRTLNLVVDGSATSIPIPLNGATLPDPAAAAVTDIVKAINAEAGSQVIASVANGGILLVSRSKGSGSITFGTTVNRTLDLLGLSSARGVTSTPGSSIAPDASYDEVQVESISGFQIGDRIRLNDGITQNWHTITNLVERQTTTGDPIYFVQWAPPPEDDRHEYRVDDKATLSTCEFDLLIHQLNTSDLTAPTLETWERLTLEPSQVNYAVSRINDPRSGSSYVVLEDQNDLESQNPPRRRSSDPFKGSDIPALGESFQLSSGSDGNEPTTTHYTDALPHFDIIAIQLLAIPEAMSDGVLKAVTRRAIDYCGNENIKGDCMFVGHIPARRDVSSARTFGRDFQASKVYGALYWPWITVTDPIGIGPNPTKQIPPTGHVLGVYARTDQTRGVWKAPAGNAAILRGALTIERDITDVDHTDLVKNGSVNSIRQIRGTGIVIDASRTLSTDTRWLYVNVRLLFNYVKASLREGLRWVKQEPNRETLWNTIKYNTVTPFLQRLYQSGAFGPGKAEDVFTVICGPENNPPEQITLGNLQVEIYFNPGRPAETIIITIGQQDSGASASER